MLGYFTLFYCLLLPPEDDDLETLPEDRLTLPELRLTEPEDLDDEEDP